MPSQHQPPHQTPLPLPLPFGTLTSIPPELRTLIYTHLFPIASPPYTYNILNPSSSPPIPLHTLLQTNTHFHTEITTTIPCSPFEILKTQIGNGGDVEYILDLRRFGMGIGEVEGWLKGWLRGVEIEREKIGRRAVRGWLRVYPRVMMVGEGEGEMLDVVCEEATLVENLGLELMVEGVSVLFGGVEEDDGGGDRFLVLSAPVLRCASTVLHGGEQEERGSSEGDAGGNRFLILTDEAMREDRSVSVSSAKMREKVVEWRMICEKRELINAFPVSRTLARLGYPTEVKNEEELDDERIGAPETGEEDWMQLVDCDQVAPDFKWPEWQLWVDDCLEFPHGE